MMRIPTCLTLLVFLCNAALAQKEDFEYMAPEGKIINYRTLTWEDFQQREDRAHAKQLAARNLQAAAYVIPAIYLDPINGKKLPNGRIKFEFRVKCAFQSHAFVRQSVKEAHSNYVLFHEQDHYDMAMTYGYLMQDALSSRDYSENKYHDEISKIYHDMYEAHNKIQHTYDGEVNPEGRDDVPKQTLWDMRVKLCLESVSDRYYNSAEHEVKGLLAAGRSVKRIPGEDVKRFATRARPIYSEFTDEDGVASFEFDEWRVPKSVLAFYHQRYYIEEQDKPTKDASRVVAYLFVPTGGDGYKRIFVDTFCYDDQAPKIEAAFFANADSDDVKELVILSSTTVKNKNEKGTMYSTKVYNNLPPRTLPGRLWQIKDVAGKLDGGFDGERNGKTEKAKYKTKNDIMTGLAELGFPNEGGGSRGAAPKKVIHR